MSIQALLRTPLFLLTLTLLACGGGGGGGGGGDGGDGGNNKLALELSGENNNADLYAGTTRDLQVSILGGSDTLTYVWLVNGSENSALLQVTSDGSSASFNPEINAEPGEYTITVTAVKDSDTIRSNALTLTVIADNQPLAAFTATQDGKPDVVGYHRNSVITLDASSSKASKDTDSTGLNFAWTLVKPQDSETALSSTTDASTNFSPDIPGTYSVTLTVSINGNSNASAPIPLSVINRAPNAPTITLDNDASSDLYRGDTRTLTATTSDDDGDTDFSYTWLVNGSVNNALLQVQTDSSKASFKPITNTALGEYQITVTAKDPYDGESPASTATTLSIINRAPHAPTITLDNDAPSDLYRGDTRTLTATTDLDPDGDDVTYTWLVNGEENPDLLTAQDSTATFSAKANTPVGEYTIKLSVSDGYETVSDSLTLTVIADNQPLALFRARQENKPATRYHRNTITLDASSSKASKDTDSTGLNFSWTLLKPQDSETALSSTTDASTNFSPDIPGTYSVTLTVSINGNSNASAPIPLSVINRAPHAPTITLDNDASSDLYRGDTRTLTATTSDDDGDTDFSYTWLVNGSVNNALLQVQTDSSKASFKPITNTALGEYQITVTAKDPYDGESPASTATTLSVINRAPHAPTITLDNDAPSDLYRGDTRTLTATTSDDDGDTDFSYTWTVMQDSADVSNDVLTGQDDNDSRVTFTAPTAATALGNTYDITATASDGHGDGTSNASVSITLSVVELKAVITTLTEASTLNTQAQWSAADSSGVGLRYQWTLEHSPDGATALGDATNETLSYTPNKNGQYQLKLTVTDAENNSDSSSHVFGIGKNSNKVPIVSGIISVDPSGLKANPQQYLMLQAIDPDGDMLFTEWLLDESCGTFADDGIYQGSPFALLTVSASATGECIVTAIVSDGYDDSVETTQSFTIEPAVAELEFTYDTNTRNFTLPAQSASYSLPARYYDENGTVQSANSLQLPADWSCDPACDSQQINFANTEQTITISKEGDNSITLKLLASDNEARAILNRDDLARVRHGLGAIYFQLATINLEAKLHKAADTDSDKHWTPIGPTFSNRFTGFYDGQSLPIRNLRIHSGQNNISLFGYTGGSSTIQNIALQGFDVRGKDYVGGLVGYNDRGDISNSYARGSVSGTANVGGLVGFNYKASITGSHVSGTVYGSGDYVGGLVGYNYESSASITNSYASGNVSGNNFVGGLVGSQRWGASIKNSYASGTVSGSSNFVGGLVGYNTGTISASYWDTTIGPSTSGGGEGKSTDQMRTQTSYVGWDFDSIWGIDENSDTDPKQRINYGYPYLLCVGGQAGYSFQASDCTAE